ncbi:MAG: acyl-CoA thioesterase [Bacteroidetes bacterium]|nr:acyl-CoA thioesterase [Bacteroidota bacterium]
MYSFDFHKRVRYAETDQMGYLYYGNYAYYYEIGRVEMMRSLGLSYQKMEKQLGIMMPVMHLEVRYLRPAFYDDLITIRTTLRKMPTDTIVFHMELFNEAGKLLNGGSVKLCFVDMKTNKRAQIPDTLHKALLPYFQEKK